MSTTVQAFCIFWFCVNFLFALNIGIVEEFKELRFRFINGPDTKSFEDFQMNEAEKLLNHLKYDNNKPTVVYVYGFTEKYKSKSTQTLVESYIERGDHNILVVEWSKYSNANYAFEAIPSSYQIGEIIGKVLLKMKESGFKLENFHLIGHSLGGHLVGIIGRNVFKHSNKTFKIKRITALDPSYPLFYGIGSIFNSPLNRDDGEFVDVIHTDSNFFGAPVSCGSVDFWPNGGKNQPNCPPANVDVYDEQNFCSHRRSWKYYAESVRSLDFRTFHSISCLSWKHFKDNQCDFNPDNAEAYMGIDANPQLHGNYFLQTNADAPFNRGENGIIYEPFD
ncbi:CLUMA_CG014924, isoform A [Clunio marinus]|uniref:CLUMA_CG014924, isoform A n=1 Tax=Clunio marinus TaxID=568069 RepID=A0A1J1IQ95_9DIPT|nr:CLUMA_CG014924, isoform A [Clunio marinus]